LEHQHLFVLVDVTSTCCTHVYLVLYCSSIFLLFSIAQHLQYTPFFTAEKFIRCSTQYQNLSAVNHSSKIFLLSTTAAKIYFLFTTAAQSIYCFPEQLKLSDVHHSSKIYAVFSTVPILAPVFHKQLHTIDSCSPQFQQWFLFTTATSSIYPLQHQYLFSALHSSNIFLLFLSALICVSLVLNITNICLLSSTAHLSPVLHNSNIYLLFFSASVSILSSKYQQHLSAGLINIMHFFLL
jgi:hypothetical protein